MPDTVSPELLSAFDRLRALMASPEPLQPGAVREFESLHLLVMSELVTRAKDARPFLSLQSRNLTLPASHLAALRFVHECRSARAGAVSSALKWIPKKLGLNSLVSALVRDDAYTGPTFKGDRELSAVSRDIERAVSESLVVVGTHAMLPDDSTRADFLETIRPMLEHTPVKFRHETLLAIAGYFRAAPDAGGVFRRPLPTVAASWAAFFPKDLTCATWPARAALPFLLVVARQEALASVRAREGADAAAAVEMADRASVQVVARLLKADTAGYTLGAVQRWAARQAVEGTRGLSNAVAEDRQKQKSANEQKMERMALLAGWEAGDYLLALKSDLVADLVAAAGNDVVAGSLQSDAHCALASAIVSTPSCVQGRELVRAVSGVLCAAALAKTDASCAGQLRQLRRRTFAVGADGSVGGGGEDMALWQSVLDVLVQRWASLLAGTRAPQQVVRETEAAIRRGLLGSGEAGPHAGGGGAGGILWEWRQPHLLLELYAVLADEPDAEALLRNVMQWVLQVGGAASAEQARFSNKYNRQHLDALDPAVVAKWTALQNAPFSAAPEDGGEGEGEGKGRLVGEAPLRLGSTDMEALMMMGEDMRTCMSIERSNKRTLKGLLAYMSGANARLLSASPVIPPPARATAAASAALPDASVGDGDRWIKATDPESGKAYYWNVQTSETRWDPPASDTAEAPGAGRAAAAGDALGLYDGENGRRGKWRARAVARLLQRRDTGETVLFLDRPYFEGERDEGAEAQIRRQGALLAQHLGVGLFSAQDTPPSRQALADLKVPRISGVWISCVCVRARVREREKEREREREFACVHTHTGLGRAVGCTQLLGTCWRCRHTMQTSLPHNKQMPIRTPRWSW